MAQIREVMTGSPRTVHADDTAADAAKLMRDEDAGIAPVTENGGKLIGVVTDRDIAIRVVAEGKDPSTKVVEIASGNLHTVEPQQDLEEALQLMAEHQVRRLPVVEGGKLVGIVAQADVARHAEPEQTGRVVEEISE
jgi:CBS domain-containing protein